MNILMLDLFGSFQTGDLHYFFQKMGNKCKYIQYLLKDKNGDDTFEDFLVKELNSNSFDMVFSTNYYPAVARVCYRMNIPYCSWTYDSPPEITSLDTMDYPTNRIFFFSKYDYSVFADRYGLENVYYLPLAVNTERLEKIKPVNRFSSDVALVGGLYKSDSFLGLKAIMSTEQQQYVDAVIAVQLGHSGSGVIDASLTDEFVEGVCAHYKNQSPTAIQPTKEQLFYSFCSHITHMDRLALLRLSAQKGYHTRLYFSQLSNQDRVLLEKYNVELMGNVSYEEEMPQVFKSTKINLNPTLRANRTGIPLRIVDILGCGGFMLSTHQAELDDFFFDGEVVYYETTEEAVELMDYYLAHDEEREKVASAGLRRVKEDFSFEDRIEKMLGTIK